MTARQTLAALLAALLLLPSAYAQQPAGNSLVSKDARLKVFVLQGAGARNSVRGGTATQTVVEVRDEFNQPVRGADVAFQLPTQGPGGFFTGQRLAWTGKTDANGQVAANTFIPNDKPGRFNIQVSATYGPKVGYAFISQTNSIAPISDGGSIESKGKLPTWAKVAIVAGAAAAAGGIVWGVRRGNDRPSVVLQPGTISLSGPR